MTDPDHAEPHAYRQELPPPPRRIAKLPLDERGFPVPWFVSWFDGKPDFRIVAPERVIIAHRRKLCWVCGDPLGAHKAFVIGPMCVINRVSSEPPSHRECAEYAAAACPFLSKPRMRRNDKDLPEKKMVPGIMIARKPGVTSVWLTRSYRLFRVDNGVLFEIGEPDEVHFYCEGRPARRAEVEASVASGLPLLEAQA